MGRISFRRARAATTLAVLTVATATAAASSAQAEPFLLTTGGDPGQALAFGIPSTGLLNPLAGPFAASPSATVAAVAPDGRSLYLGYELHGLAPIRQYDIAANGATTPKSVPEVVTGAGDAWSVAVAPDGRRAFAVDLLGGQSAVLDVGAGGRLENARPIPGTFSPVAVAVGADSRSVYVADHGVIRQYDLAGDGTLTPKTPASLPVSQPGVPVVSPDGRRLYLPHGTFGSTSILQFDIDAEGRLTPAGSPVPAPGGPIAITPDGRSLFIYGAASGTTTIHQFAIAAEDGALTPRTPATVTVAAHGSGMVVAPDSGSLYLADLTNDRLLQYTVTSGGTLAPKSPAEVATGNPRTLAVTPSADLALSISSSPEPTAADEEVTYTITVTNELGTPEGGARVTTALPAGLTLVGAATPGGTCTTSGPVECDIAPLGQGQSTTVTVRARAVAAGTHAVGASVTGLAPDPDAADNTGTGAVTVVPRAIVTTAPAGDVAADRATLHGVATPSAPGTTARFELGPSDAYGTVTSTVAIPDGAPPTVVSAVVAGLAPRTTYHYRLVVTDSTGATIRGADRTFTTAAAPAPPPQPERIETIRTVVVTVEADRTPPTVSGVALTPRRLRMRVSEAAAVRAEIAVRRTRRGRAARWVVVHRGTAETTESGTATLRIPRRLVAGRYRITVRGSDAAGNAGRITATRTIRKARGS